MKTSIQSEIIYLLNLLFLFGYINISGQTASTSFTLTCGKKIVEVRSGDVLELYMNNIVVKGLKVNRKVSGFFRYIDATKIVMDTVFYKDKYLSKSEKTRKHWTMDTASFKISDINLMKTARVEFFKVLSVTALSSLVVAFIVSPLVSIEGGKLNMDRVATISGISLGTAGLSLALSIVATSKHHRLISNDKKTKLWKIQK